jgi:hypothetical protein
MTAARRLATVALVACGSPTPPAPLPTSEWTEFYGIQYMAPRGTDARVTRSVLPGPGGEGGSPTDERPYVTLAMAGPHGFHVEITKSREAATLDATKAMYAANHVGTDHIGVVTSTGWEMTYQTRRSDDPAKPSTARVFHVDLGGGHYECVYDEQNCPDPAAAESICRSMRLAP